MYVIVRNFRQVGSVVLAGLNNTSSRLTLLALNNLREIITKKSQKVTDDGVTSVRFKREHLKEVLLRRYGVTSERSKRNNYEEVSARC